MEKIKKVSYEAPATEVIEIKVGGAVLTVSGDAPQYDGPYEF